MAEQRKDRKQRRPEVTNVGLITLEDVLSLSTADLIAVVSGPGLEPKSGAAGGPAGMVAAAHSVQQLLERFDKCDKELGRLQHQVDLRADRVRREAAAGEAAYKAQVAGLEAQWGEARAAFADLEGRMNRVTQAATKIGNRLQNADLYRRRALDAVEAVERLQEFAHASDPSHLGPLFHDNTRLAEAAATTGKLLAVTQDLISARERVGLAGQRRPAGEAPQVGTIEAAAEQLELYRNLLDNRLVARFDAALSRHDLPAMADCARIMAGLSRGEDILAQRYISTRPLFTSPRELQFVQQRQQLQADAAAREGEEGGEPADAAVLSALGGFYRAILAAMRDEAVVVEQVFPSPGRALYRFVQRVFEQKVATAVEAVLGGAPPAGSPPAALRARLRLLAEVYRRTAALADDLQELCGRGGQQSVRELADSVCGEALSAHLPLELAWLRAAHEQRAAARRAAGGGLCMEEVLALMAMNEEAVSRCVLLSAPAQLPAAVGCLFHWATPQQAAGGSLLDQLAAHLLAGLGQAAEGCARAAQEPCLTRQLARQQVQGQAAAGPAAAAAPPGSAPPSRQEVERGAALWVAGGLGALLQAVSTAGAMVSLLQQHFQRVVAPHLEGGGGERRGCLAALAGLVRAVEQRVGAALQRCLALLLARLDAGLAAEQDRQDFLPPEGAPPPPLDTPTPACRAACALLGAAVDAAEQHLHGPNLAAFLAEMGRRLRLALEAHQQRFTFSPLGALRWRRDLAEYAALGARLRCAAAARRLQELAEGAALLLVAPDSLPALVDSNPRLSHAAALAVVRLRHDFRTARLGDTGATLAAHFSGE